MSFVTLPQVLQVVIMKTLGHSRSRVLESVCQTLKAAVNSPERLTIQRRQWGLLFQHNKLPFTESFAENEKIIRSCNEKTIEMTDDESRAWDIAVKSLQTPPLPLSEGEKTELMRENFPELHKAMTTTNFDPESEDAKIQQLVRFNTECRIRSSTQWEDDPKKQIVKGSVSTIAFVMGDFITFLKIFAIDGDRFIDQKLLKRCISNKKEHYFPDWEKYVIRRDGSIERECYAYYDKYNKNMTFRRWGTNENEKLSMLYHLVSLQ